VTRVHLVRDRAVGGIPGISGVGGALAPSIIPSIIIPPVIISSSPSQTTTSWRRRWRKKREEMRRRRRRRRRRISRRLRDRDIMYRT
jgi:hypothetical protein